MPDLRELVRAERLRRGWSVRQAAAAGGCSNTALSPRVAGASRRVTPCGWKWPTWR